MFLKQNKKTLTQPIIHYTSSPFVKVAAIPAKKRDKIYKKKEMKC